MKVDISEYEVNVIMRAVLDEIASARNEGAVAAMRTVPTQVRSSEQVRLVRSSEQVLKALSDAFAAVGRGEKITAIKYVREATGCGLKEAKDIVECFPFHYPLPK